MAEQTEMKKQTWVCAGSVELKGGILGVEFYELDENGAPCRSRLYPRSKFRQARVGVIYEIDASESSALPDSLRWKGNFEDPDKIVAWTAREQAYKAERARKEGLRKPGPDVIVSAMLTLHKSYIKLSIGDRELLERLIIRVLRYGKID